jgi:hypothetical protein
MLKTFKTFSEINEDMANTNDMDHMIKRVAVVADICTKMGNKPLMYRQVKGVVNNAHKFAVKVTPQENRKYNGNAKNPAQAKVIQALNIKNPVWASLESHTGTRGPFGENNIMIPIGSYKINYSSKVKDLGRKDDVEKFLDTYKTGWPDASHGDNEIVVDCVNYYLINVGELVGKYTGKKAKDIIDKSSRDWNNLNKEMLKAKFGTYRNVGWYLANPVTNYLNWMVETQKKRTAALVGS